MEQRLTLITLGVDNLPAMKDFYQQKFGWKLLMENESVGFFKLNGIMLSLFGKEELAADAGIDIVNSGPRSYTLAHNLRSEKEVDELFAALEAKDVTIVKPPQKVFWGGYSGYIADIENNLWEIAYNPFLELDAEGNVLSMKM